MEYGTNPRSQAGKPDYEGWPHTPKAKPVPERWDGIVGGRKGGNGQSNWMAEAGTSLT
jgi:hypothetical protein